MKGLKMLIEQLLDRARERLVVIEAGALVRDAAELMATPQVDLLVVCNGRRHGWSRNEDGCCCPNSPAAPRIRLHGHAGYSHDA